MNAISVERGESFALSLLFILSACEGLERPVPVDVMALAHPEMGHLIAIRFDDACAATMTPEIAGRFLKALDRLTEASRTPEIAWIIQAVAEAVALTRLEPADFASIPQDQLALLVSAPAGSA